MSNKSIIPRERIEETIYLIRGEKVMPDRDLAKLYDYCIIQSGSEAQSRSLPGGLHVSV